MCTLIHEIKALGITSSVRKKRMSQNTLLRSCSLAPGLVLYSAIAKVAQLQLQNSEIQQQLELSRQESDSLQDRMVLCNCPDKLLLYPLKLLQCSITWTVVYVMHTMTVIISHFFIAESSDDSEQ